MASELFIEVSLQVGKPKDEVFEAIADPARMSGYFISESTGRMEEGKEVTWKFPEFDIRFPVNVIKVTRGEKISFRWDSVIGKTTVEIILRPAEGDTTLVTITERGAENNEEGIKWLKGNTMGWANFLACLKAYLEYGINLRKGSFDFMKDHFDEVTL